jgi:hypothetical protein
MVTGCAKTYTVTVKDKEGCTIEIIEFASYALGDQTYTLSQEWYEDGKPKSRSCGFSRNISSLVGQALDGLSKAIGAASNKF